MGRKIIGVVPAAELGTHRRLLLTLSSLFPVEFRQSERDSYEGLDGLILFDGSREAATRAATAGVRCYAVLNVGGEPVCCESINVDFGKTTNLHPSLHHQTLTDADVKEFIPLSALPGDEPVTSKEGRILWIYRSEGRSGVDLLAAAPPRLADGQYIWEHFQTGQFLRLLPLFHFLRDVTKDTSWTAPPLRACVMFDDPNLHGRSYGYVNYKDLVQHAKVHNYHVGVATIPIDTWHVHSETARLFRENSSRISLLIHGNNHTHEELAFSGSDGYRLGVLAQALRRIERLESDSGLEVSRVMSAPHSACTEEMMHLMLLLGYEAICLPWDSLFHYNPQGRWSSTIGVDMVGFQNSGLPIIPRVRLRPEWDPRLKFYPDWKTGILLSAFLSQPLIPVGHHHVASGGMELLAQVADTINRLGKVEWMDMKGIARSNYMTWLDGALLKIKMYSRHIVIQVPEGIGEISIERPWIGEGSEEVLVCKQSRAGILKLNAGRATTGIPVQPFDTVELMSVPKTPLRHTEVPSPLFRLWPMARRFLTEGRDRMRPILFKGK